MLPPLFSKSFLLSVCEAVLLLNGFFALHVQSALYPALLFDLHVFVLAAFLSLLPSPCLHQQLVRAGALSCPKKEDKVEPMIGIRVHASATNVACRNTTHDCKARGPEKRSRWQEQCEGIEEDVEDLARNGLSHAASCSGTTLSCCPPASA